MNPTQKAILDRFIRWLQGKADRVKTDYMRWLESPDGDIEGNAQAYCPGCAQIQRWVNRHNRDPHTAIHGWDDAAEDDSVQHCERCGVLLETALLPGGYNQELQFLVDYCGDGISDDEAYGFEQVFREFENVHNSDEWWAKVEPIAMRLMAAEQPCAATP